MELSGMCKTFLFYFILICLSIYCSPPSQMVRKNNHKTSNFYNNSNNEKVESFSWDNSEEEFPFEFEEKNKLSSFNTSEKSDSVVSQDKKLSYKRSLPGKKQTSCKNFKKESLIWHKVKKGDTLFSIARNYNVDLKQICKLNNIKNPSYIKIGMLIKVRAAGYVDKRTVAKEKTGKNAGAKKKNYTRKDAPDFRWPIKNIKKVKKDGGDGVKSIGIVIFSKSNNFVASAASGVVRKVGYMRGYGNFIIIAHKNHFMTIYANLDIVNVAQGEKVKRGGYIGKLDVHNSNLHFQINEAGKPRNPLKFLPVKRG